HGGRPDQARDDRRPGLDRPRKALIAAHHAGARRAGARGAGERARPRQDGRAAADERSGSAQGASCRRRRIGTELGKSALSLRREGVPAALQQSAKPRSRQGGTVQANSVQEGGSSRDVIRHLVLLGDALENLDLGLDPAEDVLVPRPRNPWKLTVLEPPRLLERGWAREIPIDATHIGICVDGAWAIEASGLLRGRAQSVSEALETLAVAADQFERIFEKLVAAALEAGLPTVVCTLVPSRHEDASRQRAASS